MEFFQISVKSKNALNFIRVIMIASLITSCSLSPAQIQQDSLLNLQEAPHKCFKQTSSNRFHPPQFFTCEKMKKQCCIKG